MESYGAWSFPFLEMAANGLANIGPEFFPGVCRVTLA
jgi:hypothetical protein